MEKYYTSEEMTQIYHCPTRAAFMQMWRRERVKQNPIVPDPINPDSYKKLWRRSEVDAIAAPSRKKR